MWKILRNHGVPEKIVNTIRSLYDSSTSVVRVDAVLSIELLVNTTVLQGDTLNPFLFIIVLDFVLQKTEITIGLQTNPAELLPDLEFADNIVLLDQDETEVVEHFLIIEFYAKEIGLTVNYN